MASSCLPTEGHGGGDVLACKGSREPGVVAPEVGARGLWKFSQDGVRGCGPGCGGQSGGVPGEEDRGV